MVKTYPWYKGYQNPNSRHWSKPILNVRVYICVNLPFIVLGMRQTSLLDNISYWKKLYVYLLKWSVETNVWHLINQAFYHNYLIKWHFLCFFSVEFLTPVCIFLIDSIYRVYIISDMCIPTEFGWRWNKSRKTGNIWSKYTTVVRVNTTLFY